MNALIFFLYGTVFLFGVCIGSFLNCLIYRLEKGESLRGRSYCPHCKHTLAWIDLIPVISYLFLLGCCRYCRKKISLQYPLVELSNGVLFLFCFFKIQGVCFAGDYLHCVLSTVVLFFISSVLLVIFVYDAKYYLIPEVVLFSGVLVVAMYRVITFLSLATFFGYVLAALAASGFFYSLYFFSKGRWMGFGDVELAFFMGILLGLPQVLIALFFAFLFGAIIGIILMVLHKKQLNSAIPFGPFLVSGTFVALFFGPQILSWYLHAFLF